MVKENEQIDTLYEKYKYIVDILMHKYHKAALKYNIDLKELEQEAYYAFTDALKTFDESKNALLSTFISLCVARRLQKIIRKYSGKKAQTLNNAYSLDYDYNEDGTTLKDVISDDYEFEPLNNLTLKENYLELINKIKESLSVSEYEVFCYIINGFDYQTIALLTNHNTKQIDNTIQRIKHKIRDIIKE